VNGSCKQAGWAATDADLAKMLRLLYASDACQFLLVFGDFLKQFFGDFLVIELPTM